MKYILYLFASLSFGIGFLGIFLPLIPTVPLFLLGIFLLAKVSRKNVVRIKKVPLIGKRIYRILKEYSRKRRAKQRI